MLLINDGVQLAGVRKKVFNKQKNEWETKDFYVHIFVFPNILQAQLDPKIPRETYSIADIVTGRYSFLDQNGNVLPISQADGNVIIG